MRRGIIFLILLWLLGTGCSRKSDIDLSPDHTVLKTSKYPVALNPHRVGSYPAVTKSGAGYFYDEVLEYRVWMHPERGGDDYYRAFASFERATEFASRTPGAEEPLALVHQLEWINEPLPGRFEAESGDRMTEWQVEWLAGHHRTTDSIRTFLLDKRGHPSSAPRSR